MNEYSLSDLFEKYLQYCEVIRNYSNVTLVNYRGTFYMFLRDSGVKELRDLNKHVLEQWFFDGRLKRKWTAVTFRGYHKHLNTFMKWLVKENMIDENYLDGMEKPRLETRLPRTLNRDEAQLVLDASFHMRYRYKFEKYRNRAMIGAMLFCGLRRQEVINLKINDVSLESGTIFVNQGKGSKDRIVPLNRRISVIFSEYLKERGRLYPDALNFFLSVGRGRVVGVKCIDRLMTRLRAKTKLDFSSHTLRHSFATLMLEGGCDIYTLSKIMGHSKITTTTIYLSCSNEQMSKSIEKHVLN